MRGLLSFFYGVTAYGASVATLAYFVGFSANLLVPRSVDVGPGAPWPQALLTDVLLLALFGLQHSVMARRGFKAWWRRVAPPAVERSTFVVASSAVLVVMFRFWVPIDTPVIWHVDHRAGAALLWAGFGLGCMLTMVSTFLLNHFELFGLQQVFARLRQRAVPEAQFRTPLLYRFVRHPLYLGFLVTFWSVPVMTAGRLLFALGFTAYIFIGIAFEERDLVRAFGERYRTYRQQVGMVIPRLGGTRRSADTVSRSTRG